MSEVKQSPVGIMGQSVVHYTVLLHIIQPLLLLLKTSQLCQIALLTITGNVLSKRQRSATEILILHVNMTACITHSGQMWLY